jgi:hypothetical protein
MSLSKFFDDVAKGFTQARTAGTSVDERSKAIGLMDPTRGKHAGYPTGIQSTRSLKDDECGMLLAALQQYAVANEECLPATWAVDLVFDSTIAIPAYILKWDVLWEERRYERKQEPYRQHPVPESHTPIDRIDVWAYDSHSSSGDSYEEMFPALDTLAVESCHQCGGCGDMSCETCGGSRSVTCPACRGTLIVACSQCRGSGAITQYHTSQEWATCSQCSGTGRSDNGAMGSLLGGIGSSLAQERGQVADMRCRGCWGKGARTETTRHPYQVQCGHCQASGRTACQSCEQKGKVGCRTCSATGRVECSKCERQGKLVTYGVVYKKARTQSHSIAILQAECAQPFAEDLARVVEQMCQLWGGWPEEAKIEVLSDQIVDKDIRPWNHSQSLCAGVRQHGSSFVAEQTDMRRIVRNRLRIGQCVAFGGRYSIDKKTYTAWAIGPRAELAPAETPVNETASGLVERAISMWEADNKSDAISTLCLCNRVAARDPWFKDRMASYGDRIPAALTSAAWRHGIASTTKAVASQAVGWVTGLWRK